MRTGYLERASLIAVYLLTAGSTPLLLQNNPQQHIKPQVLEKRITGQQSQQASADIRSLHYQLLNRINMYLSFNSVIIGGRLLSKRNLVCRHFLKLSTLIF